MSGGVRQRITRVYTGDDGESHFEELAVELAEGEAAGIGRLSERWPATGVVFRETGPEYDLDWHRAPRRQLVIMLSGGGVEIEVGSGERRRLHAGDILLAEDTTGRGHRSRAIDAAPRRSIFVTLD